MTITDIAIKYLGLPFTTEDCYRLIQKVYLEGLNIKIPDIIVHHADAKRAYIAYLKQISEYWEEIDIEDVQEYDVIAMAYLPTHPKVVQHFGVYIGNGKILHTLEKINAHIVGLDHQTIKNTIRGAYRWKNK